MSTLPSEANTGARPPDSRLEDESPARSSDSFAADHPAVQEPTEADAWDKEIQEDAKAGKLNTLLEEARTEHREGTTKPLP